MKAEELRGSNQPWDPTPAEIAAGCARIRAGWSPDETRRRSAWAQPVRWELQSVEAEELGLDRVFGG